MNWIDPRSRRKSTLETQSRQQATVTQLEIAETKYKKQLQEVVLLSSEKTNTPTIKAWP